MNPPLHVRDIERVRLLELDRPAARNALDVDLFERLTAELRRANDDPGVGALVLTGRGPVFCAGADLGYLRAMGDGSASSHSADDFVIAMRDLQRPLVVAVNGAAVGIGTTMLGYADLVLAARSARFRTPFTDMGVGPEMSSSWNLPHMIGWQPAAWMLFTSAWVDAEEARSIGLAFRVCDAGSLLDDALALASSIAAHPLESVVATKLALHAWRDRPRRTATDFENERFRRLLAAREQSRHDR